MSHATSQLLDQTLHLSDQDRGDLAARLIDRLDPIPDDEDVDAAWAHQIRERLDDLDHGRVRTMSWAEARRLIAEDADPGT